MKHARRMATGLLAICLALVAALQGTPRLAYATVDPAGCTVARVALGMTRTPTSAHFGDTVTFQAQIDNSGSGNCSLTGVTLAITTPDGHTTDVATGLDIPAGTSTPWYSVNYVIAAADIANNRATATATAEGLVHDAAVDDPISGSTSTTVSVAPVVSVSSLCLYGAGPASAARLVVMGATQDAPAGATVTVTAGSASGSATTAADGSWTVSLPWSQPDAAYSIPVRVSYGNNNATTITQNADLRSLQILGGESATTYSHQPTIAGTTGADPGATVTVTINGQSHPTTVDAAGHWVLTWPSFLDRDTYTVTARIDLAAGLCTQDTQSLQVLNNPPVAVGDSYSTLQNQPLTVPAPGVLANDSDPDGTPFVWQVETNPAHGTVVLNTDGSFTYTPNANFTGVDSFTYTDSDDIDVSNVATVTIHVGAPNHPPVGINDAYTVRENHTLTVPARGVLTNDTDPDGDALTASPVTGTAHGVVLLNGDGSFTYTPNPGYTGKDSFVYLAEDGASVSNETTVDITVTAPPPPPPPPPPPVNHPPVAANDAFTVNEDAVLTAGGQGVLQNDSDPDHDMLTASLVGNPAHGSVVLNPNGTFVYKPSPLFHGTDTFTYRVSDGLLMSNVATVTVTVNHVNHAPEARDDAYSVVQGEMLTVPAGGILGNDFDKDGQPITGVLVAATSHGTVSFHADGGFSYLPEGSFTGEDSFAYKVTDGQADSNVAHVTITVRPGIVPVRPVLQGTVTDAVTKKALEGAQVHLFWADTPLNAQHGRTAGADAASQATTSRGAFSWQVEADSDYYIVASMAGYTGFDSRTLGLIHVGTDPVNYDLQLQPIHQRFILGYPDGTFKPERSITRAEIAAIFARIIQPTRVVLPAAPFADVPESHWANTYIELVREKGLMVGSPDGNFRPDAPITRAELAQILARFRGLTPLEQGPFTDTAGNWAEQAINAAYAAGLITGYPDSTFHPSALTTRAEAATMINRVLGRGPLTGRSAPTWPDVPFDHWASGQVEEASTSHTADGAPAGGEHWTSDTGVPTW